MSDFGNMLFGLEDSRAIDEQARKEWMMHCIEECRQACFRARHFGECATG